jgi:hypothetical protein
VDAWQDRFPPEPTKKPLKGTETGKSRSSLNLPPSW